ARTLLGVQSLAGSETTPPRRPSGSFTAARTSDSPKPHRLATLVSVLVVDEPEAQAQIRAALPPDTFEILVAEDSAEALRVARSSAPDVVLVDRDLALRAEGDFIRRLRSDPLTDFVPVILLLGPGNHEPAWLREAGADDGIRKPVSAHALIRSIGRLTDTLPDRGELGLEMVGDVTLSELADRIAVEMRRGIVESAERGRDLLVPVGDGAELMAAAWSTIARVRAAVARRSEGRVRFRDSARRGGPAMLALVDDELPVREESDLAVPIQGREIVVVDDDPEVRWFFAGLLRDEGATVMEAEDGEQALGISRQARPDVIISDILMPRMDGFELCRQLRRDPMLAELPVVLLSWKEDFLQRMRDLKAGAKAYLRKEADREQILGKVRDVLRPRANLESRLRSGGEVRGRIEGLGIAPLLYAVADERTDSRVTVRDAWNLFEVDLRSGQLANLTRTATDGTFARGPRALAQLLGVTAGRYTIDDATRPVRAAFEGTLEDVLSQACYRLGAAIDAVSGSSLAQVDEIDVDEDVGSSFLRNSPGKVASLVERIKLGERPREMLLSGTVDPSELEEALVDLVRRGAVLGVRDAAGRDMIASHLEQRLEEVESSLPSTPAPAPHTEAIDSSSPEVPLGESTPILPKKERDLPEQFGGLEAEADQLSTAIGPSSTALSVDDLEVGEDWETDIEASINASESPVHPLEEQPQDGSFSEDLADPSEKRSGTGMAVFALVLAALAVAGYLVWPTLSPPSTYVPPDTSQKQQGGVELEDSLPQISSEQLPPVDPESHEFEEAAPIASFGRLIEGTESEVRVRAGQGLLRVTNASDAPDTEVRIGDRRKELPVELALREGIHQISFRREGAWRHLFVMVREDFTRVAELPSEP
ncbi:MAG: response regulator, partial [Myxococcota bacterium]